MQIFRDFSCKNMLQQLVFIVYSWFSTIVDKRVEKLVRNNSFPLKLFHNPIWQKLFTKAHNGCSAFAPRLRSLLR